MNFLPDHFPNALAPSNEPEPLPQMIGEHVVRQLNEVKLLCCLADNDEMEDIILAFVRTSLQNIDSLVTQLTGIAGTQIKPLVIWTLENGKDRLWRIDDFGIIEHVI